MKKILLLIMLPFIGFGQITYQTAELNVRWETDTIPCYLLVSDTSTHVAKKIIGCKVLTSSPPQYVYEYGDEYQYKDLLPKVIEGHVCIVIRINAETIKLYFDEKKKPLNKNYIVWQVIEK
jgi:hypothetical protein